MTTVWDMPLKLFVRVVGVAFNVCYYNGLFDQWDRLLKNLFVIPRHSDCVCFLKESLFLRKSGRG